MKNTPIIPALALLLTFFSCNQYGEKKPIINARLKNLTVAFSGYGCESACLFIAVSVDESRQLHYYGGRGSEKYGYYQGQISEATWDSIQTRLGHRLSSGIDTSKYDRTDHPEVQIIMHNYHNKVTFQANSGKLNEDDLENLYWFIELPFKTSVLNPTDSMTFETTIQYPLN